MTLTMPPVARLISIPLALAIASVQRLPLGPEVACINDTHHCCGFRRHPAMVS